MIPLKLKPNVYAPDVNYSFGDIKDDTGVNDGTPVNRLVYADMHQFLESIMSQGGITGNNLPDNDTNGYQLIAALLATINKQLYGNWVTVGSGGGAPGFQHSWAWSGAGSQPMRFRKELNGTVLRMTGVVQGGSSGSVIFTLPAGFIPLNSTAVSIPVFGNAVGCSILINGVGSGSDGQVQVYWTGTSNVSIECTVALT
jgi:hypothetical protein